MKNNFRGATISAGLALCTLWTPSRALAEGALEVGDGEVYLDPATGHFSSALTASPDSAIKVVMFGPKEAHITLLYWILPDNETKCDLPPKAGLQRRAGAPTGPADGGRQKFLFKVGPLKYAQNYCFNTETFESRTLKDEEKKQVEAALASTVRRVVLSPPNSDGTAPVEDDACRSDDPAKVPADCIAAVLAQELGWSSVATEVQVPGSRNNVSVRAGFAKLLRADEGLREKISDELDRTGATLKNETRAYEALNQALTQLQTWPDEQKLDPIATVGSDDVIGALDKNQHAKAISALEKLNNDKDRAAFVATLRTFAAAIAATKGKIDDKQFEILKRYLESDSIIRYVEVKKADIEALMRSALSSDIAGLPKAIDKVLGLLLSTSSADDFWKGAPKTAADAAARIAIVLELLEDSKQAAQHASDKEKMVKRITDSSAYASFLQQLHSVTLTRSEPSPTPFQPNFKDRFPFYVSADVGYAGLAFLKSPTATEGSALSEALPYFGLNLYFTPLDKDEPLPANPLKEAGRRLALMAGMSLYSTTQHSSIGISGPLNGKVPVLGAGYRLTDYLRLTLGTFLYNQTSVNSLSDQTHLRAGAFVAGSIDVDVIGVVKGWFSDAKQL